MVVNSGDIRCPARKGAEGQSRAKQAGSGSLGVCNEQVPPSKEKVCSELAGNRKRATETIAPHDGDMLPHGVTNCYNQTNLGVVRYVNLDGGERGDLTFRGEDGSAGQKIRGLYYEGIPWIWDRQCPNGRMYMFDPEDMFVTVDPSAMFEWTELLQWPNQLAYGRIVFLRIAVTAVARMFSAVIDGFTA